MKEIRKVRDHKVADDPAFGLIDENLDVVLQWVLEEQPAFETKENVWNWICMYAERQSWHPFEFISWWTRHYCMREELCRLVGWY